jgi:hypothetical protein
MSHNAKSYPEAFNYLVENKLQNSNTYWKCVYTILESVYPPDPEPWPASFDYTQEFTDRKCIDFYR